MLRVLFPQLNHSVAVKGCCGFKGIRHINCCPPQQNQHLHNLTGVLALQPYPVVQHAQGEGWFGLRFNLKLKMQNAVFGLDKGGGISTMDTTGLEPVTPTMSTWCSNQLSYASSD